MSMEQLMPALKDDIGRILTIPELDVSASQRHPLFSSVFSVLCKMAQHSTSKSSFSKSKLALAVAAQMLAGHVLAAPTGGQVVGGDGSIRQSGTETVVTQNTDRLAIDWQSFDIGKNERVEFVQPGQSSVALNRILGNKGSEILGRIDANGHVILVNPRGVVFGEGATINAGGLIASGLQINPDDFMNGDLVFKRIEGTDGTVINSGMINASAGGNVALLGSSVENRGLISAKLGTVILASGKEAVLTFDESGLLGVRVDEALLQDELGDKTAVKNSGEIRAENGRVLLSASTTRDVFSQAVNWGDQKQARSVTYNEDGSFVLSAGGDVENSGSLNVSGKDSAGVVVAVAENVTHTGSIHADTLQGQGGKVELHSTTTTKIQNTGIISASGEVGGDIKLLGKNVGLFDEGSVQVTGEKGGGRVLLGGDQEGLNAQVRTADFVYISEKSSIDVSATLSGDGGTAIVFAEDTARIYGSLSARGGDYSGDGGFIETSGKRGFEINNAPDISAHQGVGGHWLIDPYSITISDDSTGGFGGPNPQSPFISRRSDATLHFSILEEALARGGTVTVQTGDSQGGGDGDITVASPINHTADRTATLRLIAHNDINIEASIVAHSGGNKSAGRKLNVHLLANTAGNQGSITIAEGVLIDTGGGNFIIGDVTDKGVMVENRPGAVNVNFEGATIDVTAAGYSQEELNRYYRNRARNYLTENNEPGRQPPRPLYYYLGPSGYVRINAQQDVTLGNVLVKGREMPSEDGSDARKIIIKAGNDINLNRDFVFDNNPTEIIEDGVLNDGYTTLRLIAGNDINLNGRIRRGPVPNANWRDHDDRLHIELVADYNKDGFGDVVIGDNSETEIETIGGDFIIYNSVNVDLSNRVIDTSSPYGAGKISITATGDITLGALPMFDDGKANGSLQNPSLTAIAGKKLTISSDIYTVGTPSPGGSVRGNDIHLGAAEWDWGTGNESVSERKLVTGDGGNITLTTTGDLNLPTLESSGNITLNTVRGEGVEADPIFKITGLESSVALNGLLTLDLGSKGSAEISNITNSYPEEVSDAAANLVITSASNVTLYVKGEIILGDSNLVGFLSLTSGQDKNIIQQSGTHLSVVGNSTFNVTNGSILLGTPEDGESENNFQGVVSIGGTDVLDVDLFSSGGLILGGGLAETLIARSDGSIIQEGGFSVTETATFSAGENLTLDQENSFKSVTIEAAKTADIHNKGDLQLGEVQVAETLTLNVAEGGLFQEGTELKASELTLKVADAVDLKNVDLRRDDGSVGALSGSVASGSIAATGAVLLDEFSVTGSESFDLKLIGTETKLSLVGEKSFITNATTTISAEQVEILSAVELQNNATLTFKDVMNFDLKGSLKGGDPEVNSVIVNGDNRNGRYAIDDAADWENVRLTLNGGGGRDTLAGPNSATEWEIGDSFKLSFGPEEARNVLTFSSMETLQGGVDNDIFNFSSQVPNLSIIGGNGSGRDSADYSKVKERITVSLGSENGLLGIEYIKGNSSSRLFAQGDAENEWRLLGGGDGIVLRAGDSTQFSDFADLVGGGGADRFILSANTPVSSTLDGGAGDNTLEGPDGANLWTISGNTPEVTLIHMPVEGEPSVLVANARGMTGLKGGSGDDTFEFWVANSGIGIDGGVGTGYDTVDFSNVAGNLSVELGQLQHGGISNVDELVGNSALEGAEGERFVSKLIAVGDGAVTWTIGAENAGSVVADQTELNFRDFNQLVGGGGVDTFLLGASFAGNVSGGDGNDIFTLTAKNLLLNLDGGEGEDTLVAYQEGANRWSIMEPESELTSILEEGVVSNKVKFKGMEELIGADDYADIFIVQRTSGNEFTIVAGDGQAEDTINYSEVNGEVKVELGPGGLAGFENVIGNGASSYLFGADVVSEWRLDAEGKGQVSWSGQKTAFSGFGHWIGGSSDDAFILETMTGAPLSIQGGEGENRLDLSKVSQVVEVRLGQASNAPLSVLDVQSLKANPLFANRLTSSASQVNWTISARNAGTLSEGNDSSAIDFEGFAHLHGLGSNTFNVSATGILVAGDGPGSVNGGGANRDNLLKLDSSVTHTWTLDGPGVGSLTRGNSPVMNFAGMTGLEGGSGRDDFILRNPDASIVDIHGGGGTNSLSVIWEIDTSLVWTIADAVGSLSDQNNLHYVKKFEHIQELTGQSGVDRFLISGKTQLDFIISGAGDDEVSLSDTATLKHLNTGEGSDTITISDGALIEGLIEAGAGIDHLDLSHYDNPVVWEIADNKIGNFQYTDLEKFTAPQGKENSVQGPHSVNKWTITGTNSGTLQVGNGTPLDFSGINQLRGGDQTDTFVLAGGKITAINVVKGLIDGGGGDNFLQGNDGVNEWIVNGSNSGQLRNDEQGGVEAFENIQNLIGGANSDDFVLRGQGVLMGWIQGGEGDDSVKFEKALAVWLADNNGKGPSDGEWQRLRTDVEKIFGESGLQNHLRLESDALQSWRINGEDKGRVATVNFTGFGHLTGGKGDDIFTFEESGRVTGILNGGDGVNTVALTAVTSEVSVSLAGGAENADLYIANIRTVRANPDKAKDNELWALNKDNKWIVSGQDSGSLNDELLFSGFGNLKGGEADDQFFFERTGILSGKLDGGTHDKGDTLDYSSVVGRLELSLGGTQAMLSNIEQLVGNDHTVLIGSDVITNWLLIGEVGQGQVSFFTDTLQHFTFSRIAEIQGGTEMDIFDIRGGSLSGPINGGKGSDVFRYSLSQDSLMSTVAFEGGEKSAGDEDTLEILEGGADFMGYYSLESSESKETLGLFEFSTASSTSSSSNNTSKLTYSGMQSVVLKANLSELTLKGAATADEFILGNKSWQLNEHTTVSYLDNGLTNLRVSADETDKILVSGLVDLSHGDPNRGQLHIEGGSVEVKENTGARIKAHSLYLRNVKQVATGESPLNLEVVDLTLTGSGGPVYLREQNILNLAEVNFKGDVSITLLNGDLTQSRALEGSGDWKLGSSNGKLVLNNAANNFTGTLTLNAPEVTLNNKSDINLGTVDVNRLTIESGGSIKSGEIWVVDTATLVSNKDISLTAENNAIEDLSLFANGGDATVFTAGPLTLRDTEAEGRLLVKASSLVLQGAIEAEGDVELGVGDLVQMNWNSSVSSDSGNILVKSGGSQVLGLLSAPQGNVYLCSAAAIFDANGDGTNVEAQLFHARAKSGIGSISDLLEIEVGSIYVINTNGEVGLTNKGELTIEALRSAGNIKLINDNTVKLNTHSVNAFFGTATPEYPKSKKVEDIPATSQYHFELVLPVGGSIETKDKSQDLFAPHISAYNVSIFNAHGSFGYPAPVIYAPERLSITSGSSWERPYNGFGVKPRVLEDETPYYKNVMGAGEQLIEVESLADIDPALFTQVRNYFYRDVSIRLPSDQLYEEE
jgi:filamentous hemagglutinin family protein